MKNTPQISDAEWLVMKVVWGKSPITSNEINEALEPQTTWTPKTIMTLINRLVKKGALGFERQGRGYLYAPLAAEAECVREEGRSFLQRVYGGAVKPMLANFLEDARLSQKDIEDLKRILDEKGK